MQRRTRSKSKSKVSENSPLTDRNSWVEPAAVVSSLPSDRKRSSSRNSSSLSQKLKKARKNIDSQKKSAVVDEKESMASMDVLENLEGVLNDLTFENE